MTDYFDDGDYPARHRDDTAQGRADGIARDFFFLRGRGAYQGRHEAVVLEATA